MAPLHGIRVLDFTELLPGPFLSQNLLDMGAHVIKVERPPHGDNARVMAPGVFQAVNRGKDCIQVDLKTSEGRARIAQLLESTDILLESYRPGVMQRLGLDYAALGADHTRLVYASLSGYGQSGTRALWPGHDLNYQAASGALALSGMPQGRPDHVFGLPVADLCGAMYGLSAVLGALFQRASTGKGQYLDIALAECMAHWMNPRLGSFQHQGLQDLAEQRSDVLDKPAYGVFRCRDGRDITLCALETHFWQRLVRLLDLEDFASEPFLDYAHRARHASAIRHVIGTRVAERDSDQLLADCVAMDVPAMLLVPPLQVVQAYAQAGRPLSQGDGTPFLRFPVRLAGMYAPTQDHTESPTAP